MKNPCKLAEGAREQKTEACWIAKEVLHRCLIVLKNGKLARQKLTLLLRKLPEFRWEKSALARREEIAVQSTVFQGFFSLRWSKVWQT